MEDNIAILILFFNRCKETIRCIESFLPSGAPICVLNNGSDEHQWQELNKVFASRKQITFFNAGSNLGVSGGRNFLIRKTTQPWLFFVDNDIYIENASNWKQLFDSFLLNNPDTKIICPKIYNVHEQAYAHRLLLRKTQKEVMMETGEFHITNCFPGGASIVNRSVFETYGLYDEDMFVGFEDYEFSLRAITSTFGEFRGFYFDGIELIHDHQRQTTKSDKNAVRQRYDQVRLQNSFHRLQQKYDIEFDHNWLWWTKKQVKEMAGDTMLGKLKDRFRKLTAR